MQLLYYQHNEDILIREVRAKNFGTCYSVSLKRVAKNLAEYFYIKFHRDAEIFLHYDPEDILDLMTNYWREQPFKFEVRMGYTSNFEISLAKIEQNQGCNGDWGEITNCLMDHADKYAREHCCWLPGLPFVRNKTVCKTSAEVNACSGDIGKVMEQRETLCGKACTNIEMKVGLAGVI